MLHVVGTNTRCFHCLSADYRALGSTALLHYTTVLYCTYMHYMYFLKYTNVLDCTNTYCLAALLYFTVLYKHVLPGCTAVLYWIVRTCTTLHYTVSLHIVHCMSLLQCTVLTCTALHCTVLHLIVFDCIKLSYTAIHCTKQYCTQNNEKKPAASHTIKCNILSCNTLH